MLRRMGILSALVFALVFSAVGAASASATSQPTFASSESFPISIENSLHAGSVAFEWPTQTWGTCTENKMTGTITNPSTVALTLEWTGCKGGGTQWHSEGAPEGHVVVTGTGRLNYTSWSTGKVGIVLAITPVKLILGGSSITLRGNLVIPVSPTNTEVSKLALPVHESGLGEQEFVSYENEAHEVKEARPQIEFGATSKKAGIEIAGSNELATGKKVTVWTGPTAPPPSRPEYALGAGKFPVTLEGSAPAAVVNLGNAAGGVECTGVTVKGTITGSTSGTRSLELQHCKKSGGAKNCNTTGSAAGVISLSGTESLAYISKAEQRVGSVFTPELAEFECEGGFKNKLKGALVIPVSPVGIQTTALTMNITRKGTEYENTYTTYENEKGEKITAKLEFNFGTGYKKGFLETGELDPNLSQALTVTG